MVVAGPRFPTQLPKHRRHEQQQQQWGSCSSSIVVVVIISRRSSRSSRRSSRRRSHCRLNVAADAHADAPSDLRARRAAVLGRAAERPFLVPRHSGGGGSGAHTPAILTCLTCFVLSLSPKCLHVPNRIFLLLILFFVSCDLPRCGWLVVPVFASDARARQGQSAHSSLRLGHRHA